MGKTDQVTSAVDPLTEEPNLISRFLRLVWGNRGGFAFVPMRTNGIWYEHSFPWRPDQLFLMYPPADDSERYFCPLIFSQRERKAAYALPTRVLWADLDAADPRGVRLRPSCAWETSGGDIPHYQALWFLGHDLSCNGPGCMPGCPGSRGITAASAAALSKRIAYAEPGCDRSGWDVTQVLRLPGTLNHKYDPPHEVKFLWATKHTYTLAEVKAAYPQGQSSKTFHVGTMFPASDFPQLHEASVAAKRSLLPVGVQYELERRYDGRDRSAWLFRTAGTLLDFNVPPAVIVELLRRTPMNKFAGRSDETTRLQETVSDAIAKRSKHDYTGD